MSHLLSTTAIARILLLAGILLAATLLLSRSFLPAFAQEEDGPIEYLEGSTHVIATFAATDPDEGDTATLKWDFIGDIPMGDTDGDGTDERIFAIENGKLKFVSSPDYESPWKDLLVVMKLTDALNTYSVTIEVKDDDPNHLTATTSVTVKVTNRDEGGTVGFNNLQPYEDVQLLATLKDPDGKLHTDEDGVEFPIDENDNDVLTIQDGDHATTTWKWAKSLDGETGWIDIVATTTANPAIDIYTRVPENADVGHYLRATATYNDGQGKNKTAFKITANAVGENQVNDAPVFVHSEGNQYVNAIGEIQEEHRLSVGQPIASSTIEGLRLLREIVENSATGADVGDEVTAYDDDLGALTYSIVEDSAPANDDDTFDIERATGQIQLQLDAGTILNREDPSDQDSNNVFLLVIRAQDALGEMGTVNVAIRVNDEPENPSIASGPKRISQTEITYDSNGDAEVATTTSDGVDARSSVDATDEEITLATFTATDDEDDWTEGGTRARDAGALRWSLTGNDKDSFVLCNPGVDSSCSVENVASNNATVSTVELRLKELPDYEKPTNSSNSFRVTVNVTDTTKDSPLTDSQAVVVSIVNVDEPGSVTMSHIQPQEQTSIRAVLTETDGRLGSVRYTWATSSAPASPSDQWSDVGTGVTYRAPYAATTTTPYYLRVTATYADGHGSGKSEEFVSVNQVRRRPATNDAPTFSANANKAFEVNEGEDPGATVGTVDAAEDNTDDNNDQSVLTYTLDSSSANLFELNRETRELTTRVPLDHEARESYTVTVTATDPSLETAQIQLTITVNDQNEQHSVTAGSVVVLDDGTYEADVAEGSSTSTAIVTYKVADMDDGEELTWTKRGTDANSFDLYCEARPRVFSKCGDPVETSNGDSVQVRLIGISDYEKKSSYSITLSVADGRNSGFDLEWILNVDVDNQDETGTVSFAIQQPSQGVNFVATLTDPDGKLDESNSLARDGGDLDTNLTLEGSGASTTKWQWARSLNGRTGWTDIVATTTDNPTIDINTRKPEATDISHYLRATASYTDAHGENKSQNAVSDEPVLRNLVNDTPVFRHSAGNVYSDDEGVVVGEPVLEVNQPIASTTVNDLHLLLEVNENSPANSSVGAAVEAYDDDGNVLTYSFDDSVIDDRGSFDIERGTGQIRVKQGTDLDFEVRGDQDANGVYVVTVKATDPLGESGTVDVAIKVVDADDDPSINTGATTIELTEISDDYLTEPAKDMPMIERDSTDPVALDPAYENATGIVALHNYMATDQDDDGDNDADTEVTWSLTGRDAAQFAVCSGVGSNDENCDEASGGTVQLRFKAAPDFEDKKDSGRDNVYNVTVVATDSDDDTDTRDVTITITNVEEDGEVTLSHLQPEVDVRITAELEDPDGGETGVTWQWHMASSTDNSNAHDAQKPLIDASEWSLISGATSRTYSPTADTAGKFLRVTASYTDDSENKDDPGTQDTDESKDKDVSKVISGYVVQAKPATNATPQFPDQDTDTAGKQAAMEVAENTKYDPTGAADNVDTAVRATDVDTTLTDPGDVLIYTMAGKDERSFDINETDGQISVADGADLDHETKDTYVVTVTATDSSLASDTITVTIEVTDVNEAPVLSERGLSIEGPSSPNYAEDATTAEVATYQASGPDSSGASWSLSGNDSGALTISSAGVLSFGNTPNFESAADQDGNNDYEVTVTATMGTFTDSLNVTVIVTDVDEDGSVVLDPAQPPYRVGVEVTAELDEGDEERQVTWQWSRSQTETGTFALISNATDASYTPVSDDAEYYLRVTASYIDASFGPDSEEATTGAAVLATTGPGTPGTLALSNVQPTIGDSITATLTDADSPDATTYSWVWARYEDGSTNWTTISTSATYTVVEADAGNYLRATLTYEDDSGAGHADAATTRRVPIHRYDADADGRIDLGEAIAAINDFFSGTASLQEAIEAINLYFAGLTS